MLKPDPFAIKLSPFQNKCKEELLKKLKSIGVDIHSIEIKETQEKWFAEKEVFIEVSVDNLKFWIYEDGAHIQGTSKSVPFEAQDYDNKDDLIHAFIEKVTVFLQGKSEGK
jgi:hypothetical protein